MKNEQDHDRNMNIWPTNGLETVEYCPICGSPSRQVLYDNLTDRVFFCAPGKWTLHQCNSCQSAYLDPRPTAETIGLAYKSYFTHEQNPEFEMLNFKSKIRRALANGYRNWRYGTRNTPSNPLGILLAILSPMHRAKLDASMRYLPKPKTGQRLLDVGCGNATFLVRARSAGWDVTGVDFDPKAVAVGRKLGLDIRLGGADALDPHIEQFDVITLSHVIEHVHHPLSVLESCRSLLKPGGKIWIDTPNLNSEGRRIFGSEWLDLDPPRHLILFTLESMQNALRQAGFVDVEILPYRPLCAERFRASSAIVNKQDPFSHKSMSITSIGDVGKAERISKNDPARREFITVQAKRL